MKKLLGDVVVYGLCGTVSRFIGILLVPVYTRLLSPGEYGVIGMMLTLNAFFGFLTDLQMTSAVGRFFFTKSSIAYRKILVSSALWVIVFIAICFATLVGVFSETCSSLVFRTREYGREFYLLSGFILVSPVQSLLLYILRLERRKYWFVATTLFGVLVTVACSILLVVMLKLGVVGALGGQLLGALSILIPCIFLNRKLIIIRISKRIMKKLLWFGIPSVPARAGSWLQIAFGQIFMLKVVGLSDLGLYSLGMKFASVAMLYQNAFQMGWYPHAMSIADKPGNQEEYRKGIYIYVLIGLLVTMPFVLFAKEIIGYLCDARFLDAYRFVGILSLAYLLQGMMCVTNMGIMIKKKTGYISIAFLLSMFVTIICTVVFSRLWEQLGIATALLIGNLVQLLLVSLFSQRLYPIQYPMRLILFCFIIYVGATLYSFAGWGNWIATLLVATLISAFLLLKGFRLLRP